MKTRVSKRALSAFCSCFLAAAAVLSAAAAVNTKKVYRRSEVLPSDGADVTVLCAVQMESEAESKYYHYLLCYTSDGNVELRRNADTPETLTKYVVPDPAAVTVGDLVPAEVRIETNGLSVGSSFEISAGETVLSVDDTPFISIDERFTNDTLTYSPFFEGAPSVPAVASTNGAEATTDVSAPEPTEAPTAAQTTGTDAAAPRESAPGTTRISTATLIVFDVIELVLILVLGAIVARLIFAGGARGQRRAYGGGDLRPASPDPRGNGAAEPNGMQRAVGSGNPVYNPTSGGASETSATVPVFPEKPTEEPEKAKDPPAAPQKNAPTEPAPDFENVSFFVESKTFEERMREALLNAYAAGSAPDADCAYAAIDIRETKYSANSAVVAYSRSAEQSQFVIFTDRETGKVYLAPNPLVYSDVSRRMKLQGTELEKCIRVAGREEGRIGEVLPSEMAPSSEGRLTVKRIGCIRWQRV